MQEARERDQHTSQNKGSTGSGLPLAAPRSLCLPCCLALLLLSPFPKFPSSSRHEFSLAYLRCSLPPRRGGSRMRSSRWGLPGRSSDCICHLPWAGTHARKARVWQATLISLCPLPRVTQLVRARAGTENQFSQGLLFPL